MEALEVVLRKVEDLRRDLSAEIVHQEEEGHYETRLGYGGRGGYTWDKDFVEGEVWIVDKPKIAEPDTKKREAARTELQQIYDSSEWYSTRYQAAIILGKNVNKVFEGWMKELKQSLLATRSEAYTHYEDTGEVMLDPHGGGTSIDRAFIPVTEPVEDYRPVPDEEKRASSIKDLIYMYNNLENPDHRIEAGRSLGYSKLRIWFHELKR